MNEKVDNKAIHVGIAVNIKTDHFSDTQAEFDEPETILAISNALKTCGFETVVLEATDEFTRKLEYEKPDIVFNIAEGKSGRNREAQIPAILEYFGVPYTGSDVATLAISLDKSLTKRIVQNCGIETPPSFFIKKGSLEFPDDLTFPILVKPNAEGSSKGISDTCVAENLTQLHKLVHQAMNNYGEDLIAEQYIDGREFTVGIIGNGSDIHVFEPMEIIFEKFKSYKIYGYEVKKNFRDYISYQCPPDIPEKLKTQMMHDAEIVYNTLGCLDFARIDFRLSNDGKVYFIEANPLPGLAPGYSDFPMLAAFNGIEYNSLVCKVLYCALKRFGMKAVKENE